MSHSVRGHLRLEIDAYDETIRRFIPAHEPMRADAAAAGAAGAPVRVVARRTGRGAVPEVRPRGPRGGTSLYSSAFLPTVYQGVPFLSAGDPILNLANPVGVDSHRQRRALDAIGDLNRARLEETGDAEIATRIAAY